MAIKMRFLLAIGVVTLVFLESARSQTDCDYPTESDVVGIIQSAIVSSDATVTPVITIIGDIHLVCLAHSRVRDRYRSFSVIVNYTCTGNANCVGGANDAVPTVEQFESDCREQSGEWSNRVLGQTSLRRTQNPVANFSTVLREDCTNCATPARADASGAPILSDDDNHCISCDSCEKLNRCFGFQQEQCCNVYLPDGTCGLECPERSTETPEFECVINCANRGNVTSGTVNYSGASTSNGSYPLGTVASVVCITGHQLDGEDATCTDGGIWSKDLANCSMIDCGVPPSLLNGKFETPGSTLFGTVVTYTCDGGYSFKDNRDTRTCQSDKMWSNSDLECIKDQVIPVIPQCPEGCTLCTEDQDGKVSCTRCEDDMELKDNSCNQVTGNSRNGPCGKDNIICIIIPIAILLAIILAIIVAIAIYAYLKYRKAPDTKLREKDPEGINGVARDNPLYLDPNTVADDGEE